MDVAAHAGTLAAVTLYFSIDVIRMLRGCIKLGSGNWYSNESRFALHLILATFPAICAGGLMWYLGFATAFRNVEAIAWFTIGFGILLYVADRFCTSARALPDLKVTHAVLIGCAQVLAFLPGASRSGVTITAARALGFEREHSARFAFLLAIPTIGAATALGAIELIRSGDALLWHTSMSVFSLSFMSALAALWGLMRFVRRWSLTPFVVYRIGLGIILLWFFST